MTESVESNVNGRDVASITTALGDDLLRCIQERETEKVGWDKLPARYARRTVINKISARNAILNTKV